MIRVQCYRPGVESRSANCGDRIRIPQLTERLPRACPALGVNAKPARAGAPPARRRRRTEVRDGGAIGGFVVAVVKDVDKKGVVELARELGALSAKAREGKLAPTETQGATFAISSLGGIGGAAFTPIVNAPEVAILGVVRSRMAPVWDGKAFRAVPLTFVMVVPGVDSVGADLARQIITDPVIPAKGIQSFRRLRPRQALVPRFRGGDIEGTL